MRGINYIIQEDKVMHYHEQSTVVVPINRNTTNLNEMALEPYACNPQPQSLRSIDINHKLSMAVFVRT